MSYSLTVSYPANDVTANVLKKLSQSGWLPQAEDNLNPGLRSSLLDGWGSYIDGTRRPNVFVYQWMVDWKNENGDILRYAFQFTGPVEATTPTSDLRVVGVFIPRKMDIVTKTAFKLQSWFEKFRPNL